jgi:hypothetical protein
MLTRCASSLAASGVEYRLAFRAGTKSNLAVAVITVLAPAGVIERAAASRQRQKMASSLKPNDRLWGDVALPQL